MPIKLQSTAGGAVILDAPQVTGTSYVVVPSSGNLISASASMPTSGLFAAGDVVIEKTSVGALSGWKRLTTGSGNVLGTDWVYFSNGLTRGTTQTLSGAYVDFTGIPSWAKRVTLALNNIYTAAANSSDALFLRVGAGSIQNTGYTVANITNATNFSLGQNVSYAPNYGHVILLNTGNNTWIVSSTVSSMVTLADGTTGSGPTSIFGKVVTTGSLDMLRIYLNGNFNTAGSATIFYE